MAEREKIIVADRGFGVNDKGETLYKTRFDETFYLDDSQFLYLKVLEDILNRLLFVNILDLKHTITGKTKPNRNA